MQINCESVVLIMLQKKFPECSIPLSLAAVYAAYEQPDKDVPRTEETNYAVKYVIRRTFSVTSKMATISRHKFQNL